MTILIHRLSVVNDLNDDNIKSYYAGLPAFKMCSMISGYKRVAGGGRWCWGSER